MDIKCSCQNCGHLSEDYEQMAYHLNLYHHFPLHDNWNKENWAKKKIIKIKQALSKAESEA